MPALTNARVAGAFYLLTFVSSIPALLLIGPVLHHSDYIAGAGADTRVVWGCVLDVVNAFASVGTAVAVFPVVRRQNEAAALGFVASRLIEAAIILIGVVCLLAVVALREPGARDLLPVGRALVAVRNQTFLLGPGLMPVCNALLLGTLLYRARLVPRLIPAIGLAGAPLQLTSTVLVLAGVIDQVSGPASLLTVPIAVWEFSVGAYLLVRGVRPAPGRGGPEPEPGPQPQPVSCSADPRS